MSCNVTCPKVRLHYFTTRGRAELIRWVLAFGKADWEDVRYSQEEFKEAKSKMPNGQVPVLEFNDKEGKAIYLTQSHTILRKTAQWCGLAGKKPCESTQADEAYEVLRDIMEFAVKLYYEQDPQRKGEILKKLKEEVIPQNLAFLEKKLHAHGGKFLAGGEGFTYADLALASFTESLGQNNMLNSEEFAKQFPGLHALAESVVNVPELKTYLANRPNTSS